MHQPLFSLGALDARTTWVDLRKQEDYLDADISGQEENSELQPEIASLCCWVAVLRLSTGDESLGEGPSSRVLTRCLDYRRSESQGIRKVSIAHRSRTDDMSAPKAENGLPNWIGAAPDKKDADTQRQLGAFQSGTDKSKRSAVATIVYRDARFYTRERPRVAYIMQPMASSCEAGPNFLPHS